MKPRFALAASIAMLGAAHLGCASSPQERSDNLAREAAFQFSGGDELAQRASFDLGCPREQMRATVLQRVGMFQVAVSAGVQGCGKRASYIRSAGTSGAWVINGIAEEARQAAPPPGGPPPPQ